MFLNKKSRLKPIKFYKEKKLTDEEMSQTMGSGNSQIRFIPDEFVQSKVLKNGGVK